VIFWNIVRFLQINLDDDSKVNYFKNSKIFKSKESPLKWHIYNFPNWGLFKNFLTITSSFDSAR
jgi:hypothetical protein